ncbi:hypothetical protein D9M72_554060 [compost metagenome]
MVSPPMPQMLTAVIPSPGSIAARPLARRTVTCESRPFSRTVRLAAWNGVKATSPATAAAMAPRRIKATGR